MVESQKISFMESLQRVRDQQGVRSKDSQMYVRHCKRDLKALDIDVDSRETLASDRVAWKN